MKDNVNAVSTSFGGQGDAAIAFASNMCSKMGACFSKESSVEVSSAGKGRGGR